MPSPFPLQPGDIALNLNVGAYAAIAPRTDVGSANWRVVIVRDGVNIGSIEAADVFGNTDSVFMPGIAFSRTGNLFIAGAPDLITTALALDVQGFALDGTALGEVDSVSLSGNALGAELQQYARGPDGSLLMLQTRSGADQMDLYLHDDDGARTGSLTVATRDTDPAFPLATTRAIWGASISADNVLFYGHMLDSTLAFPSVLIKRYDLTANAQLADFASYSDAGGAGSILVLPDGGVLVSQATGGNVLRFEPDGSTFGVAWPFGGVANPHTGSFSSSDGLQLDYADPDYVWVGYMGQLAHMNWATGAVDRWVPLYDDWDDDHGFARNSNVRGIAMLPTSVPDIPSCAAWPFTAKCGDVLDAITQTACIAIECWRGGTRIGRLSQTGDAQAGPTMALDRAGDLYVPYDTTGSTGPRRVVQKYGDGAKHFSGNGTAWWTPPDDGAPILVSVDRQNTLYVLVGRGGGAFGFSSATSLRLYHLNTAASVLATYDLAVPSGHGASGITGGVVKGDGSVYLYTFGDGTDGVVAAWDLPGNTALPNFATDPGYATLYPGGLRFAPGTGKVLIANGAPSPGALRVYSANGLTHSDIALTGAVFPQDVENDTAAGFAYVSDQNSGHFFRVNVAGATSVVWGSFSTADFNAAFFPIAVMCAGEFPRPFVGFTTVIS